MFLNDWIYDIETYPNCFTLCIARSDGSECLEFEISFRRNDDIPLRKFLKRLYDSEARMVGYNNVGFDYPVLHFYMKHRRGTCTAAKIYNKAMEIIGSQRDDKFKHLVKPKEVLIKQVDLLKIHHFDNMARATSLKMLEFNMKSDDIEDLPFPVGKELTSDEIDTLIKYNRHDVYQTYLFYNESMKALEFREELSEKYGKDFTNHNDTKIGKDYFIMRLEKEMPGCCYDYSRGERRINQTRRKKINLGDVLLPYVKYECEEFQAVYDWFNSKVITETKGVLTDIPEHELGDVAKYCQMVTKRKKLKDNNLEDQVDKLKQEHPLGWYEAVTLKSGKISHYFKWNIATNLNVVIDNFRYDFGTGGIHGSVESQIVESDDHYVIVDLDVASYYPNLAIANRVYPAHLSEVFCDIYEDVYNDRRTLKKAGKDAEQQMMKLALNGVYGDSNSVFSPFYDSKYTMTITINGQLSLCMLAEELLKIKDLTMIQVNTDGLTVKLPRDSKHLLDKVWHDWEGTTGLELEEAIYSRMIIRDVNNYIAEKEASGELKRKGAYEYDGLGWHQNQSSLVIQKAAEHALVHGGDLEGFIRNHDNKYDFMLRTKVPRSSRLVSIDANGVEKPQQNICRYYICKDGSRLVKIMPPIEGKYKDVSIYVKDNGEIFEADTKTKVDRAESRGWELREKIRLDPTERYIGIDREWKVKTCNNILDFKWNVEYDYYIQEARKLVEPLLKKGENND